MIYLQSSSIIPRFEAETVREPAMGHIWVTAFRPITIGPYAAHYAQASADFTGTMPIVGRKRRAVWESDTITEMTASPNNNHRDTEKYVPSKIVL